MKIFASFPLRDAFALLTLTFCSVLISCYLDFLSMFLLHNLGQNILKVTSLFIIKFVSCPQQASFVEAETYF